MLSRLTGTIFFSLLFIGTLHAEYEPDPIELCRDMSIVARDVMTARQKGKPMSHTLPETIDRIREIIEGQLSKALGVDLDDAVEALDAFGIDEEALKAQIEGLDDTAREAAEMMVIPAYDVPSFSTPGNQRDAIDTFENGFFESCYLETKSD